MLYQKLNKPEYWFRPGQIIRKLEHALGRHSSSDHVNIRLPWGTVLQINPRETIGQNVVTLGVYELAVSEVLWRLTEPGDWCLDIGANIGYMTSLLAARAQTGGKVFSFEPHPIIFGRLQTNLANCANQQGAPIQSQQIAVGATDGKTHLVEPDGFNNNEGNAQLTDHLPSDKKTHPIDIARLDALFCAQERFGVVKVDVEGWELSVFQGAAKLLAEHRIRDIVFEDFAAFPSDSVRLLQQNGYAIFRLAKKISGPLIWDPAKTKAPNFLLSYEPVNYLATMDPQRALKLLQPRGWFCLKSKVTA